VNSMNREIFSDRCSVFCLRMACNAALSPIADVSSRRRPGRPSGLSVASCTRTCQFPLLFLPYQAEWPSCLFLLGGRPSAGGVFWPRSAGGGRHRVVLLSPYLPVTAGNALPSPSNRRRCRQAGGATVWACPRCGSGCCTWQVPGRLRPCNAKASQAPRPGSPPSL